MRPTRPARELVKDAEGHAFGELDFPTADHLEVFVGGKTPIRVGREHFDRAGASAPWRLKVKGDNLFVGKHVTTIDGIDLGAVTAVVHEGGGGVETLIVGGGGEDGPVAVPIRFVREVSAHIILEPSVEEVEQAQAAVLKSPRVGAAISRARKRA